MSEKKIYLITTRYFFDLVLRGEKKVEYRRDIPYYQRVFAAPVDRIVLHYRQGTYLTCEVSRVRRIERPEALRTSQFITTPYCYAIELRPGPHRLWGKPQRGT